MMLWRSQSQRAAKYNAVVHTISTARQSLPEGDIGSNEFYRQLISDVFQIVKSDVMKLDYDKYWEGRAA